MRSSRQSSSKTMMWAAGVVLLIAAAGGTAWLLSDESEAPQSPTAAPVAAEPEPEKLALPEPTAEHPIENAAQSLPTLARGEEAAQPLLAARGPSGTITGKVVDQHGQPVAATFINVYQGNALLPGPFPGSMQILDLQTKSTADGSFTIAGVPAGASYVLVGEHENYAKSETPNLRVEANQTLSGVTLVLTDGAVVRGNVTQTGGSPIANARVELHDTMAQFAQKPEQIEPAAVVFADAAGRYAFTHVSSRFFRVRASADGFETLMQTGNAGFEPGPSDMVIDFELSPGRSLPGRVVDVNMNPIAGARIEVQSIGKEPQSTSDATSDETGFFRLDGLGTSTYQLHATCKGYSDKNVPKLDVTAGEFQVTMEPRGYIEGNVVSAAGSPVTHFALYLMRSRPNADPNYLNDHRSFNDAGGRFNLGDLDPGDYIVEARADGLADTRSEPFTVGRGPDPSAQLRIIMSAGGTLAGTVLDPTGSPVGGASVVINPNNYVDSNISKIFNMIAPTDERERSTASKEDGTFVFEHVTPGVYQVRADHPDFAAYSVNDVQINDDSAHANAALKLTLPKGAVIAGQAVDDTGPMAFCKVQINQKDSTFMDAGTTDKDGYFRFRNLAQGEYQVTVMPEKVGGEPIHPFMKLVYAKNSQKDVYVGEGQVLDGVLLQLHKN